MWEPAGRFESSIHLNLKSGSRLEGSRALDNLRIIDVPEAKFLLAQTGADKKFTTT